MDKWHLKCQGAMEFLILAGFLLFMFIMIFGVISSNTSDISRKRDILRGEDLVTKVQKEVNLAAKVVDGYYREFQLPQKIGSKNYTIRIVENEVIASTDKNDFWRVIPNMTGNITKGTNRINKTNGKIYLN